MDIDYEDDFWEYALTLDLGIERGGLLTESASADFSALLNDRVRREIVTRSL